MSEPECVPAEPGESELLNQSAGFLLNQTATVIRMSTAKKLVPFGILPRHISILETIAHHGELSQQEIGERLGIDRTSMVQFIDRLESLELVARQVNPEDRRCYALCLTPGGQTALVGIRRAVIEAQEPFLQPLSGAEWEQMRVLLLKLLRGQAR